MVEEIFVRAKVVSSDGKVLGEVKKVEQNAFLVDAPMQFDYWLEASLVKTCDEERLELTVAEADLGAYKMDTPNDHNAFQQKGPAAHDRAVVQSRVFQGGTRPGV